MILSFKKEYLRELYETGTTSSKKHRFQPEIIRAYVKCIYRLEEAIVPEDLYKYKSLNFEALVGDKNGLYSVRVNNQYLKTKSNILGYRNAALPQKWVFHTHYSTRY